MSLKSEPTKKCPYCYTRIKREARRCTHCDQKVGPPDKFGIAKKPVNWVAYISAFISCGLFGYFIYWLFFLQQSGD